MGYSMGARVTAFLAHAHPERVRSAILGGLGIRLVDGVGLPESIAEALEAPSLADVTAVVQPHCHQYSSIGFEADREFMASLGATVTEAAGCCGLAGNWGTERGHYDVSVAVAENSLLPALRSAAPGSVYIADGVSCRTQAEDLAGVSGLHLAQLLAERI